MDDCDDCDGCDDCDDCFECDGCYVTLEAGRIGLCDGCIERTEHDSP